MGRRRSKGRDIHGWLVINKPLEMSSMQAVSAVRRILDAKKAGHAGTLDPLASGVLPIALGEATKTVAFAQDKTKGYRFTVRWGQQTDTDDAEGRIIQTSDIRPSQADIESILPDFHGLIQQVPPTYSAIKVDGERAYKLAREHGQAPEMKPRAIDIASIRLIDMPDRDHACFEVICGKGSYMRALGRDLGLAVGGHGHLVKLERFFVGHFTLETALSLAELEDIVASESLSNYLQDVAAALDDIPALSVTTEEARRLRLGNRVAFLSSSQLKRLEDSGFAVAVNDDRADRLLLARDEDDVPLAIVRFQGGALQPVRGFNLGNVI